MYIATSEELSAFCERAKTSHILAVDTEFLREKTYFPKLCLVQVSTGSEIAAIDPLLIDDLTPLKELLEIRRLSRFSTRAHKTLKFC